MDNRGDRFAGGFIAGTLFGSIVGGFLGAFLNAKLSERLAHETDESTKPLDRKANKRLPLKPGAASSIEEARQSLEAKIAQLNEAIDEARQQLSNVNSRD